MGHLHVERDSVANTWYVDVEIIAKVTKATMVESDRKVQGPLLRRTLLSSPAARPKLGRRGKQERQQRQAAATSAAAATLSALSFSAWRKSPCSEVGATAHW